MGASGDTEDLLDTTSGDRSSIEIGGGRGGIMSAPIRRTLRDGEIPQTTVRCEHADRCAGCPVIDVDYTQQLTMKRARVVGATSRYPTLELLYTSPTTPADPIVGYRSRAKLVVSPTGALGLFDRAGHHEVIDIPQCRVLSPALNDVANALRALLRAPPVDARALLLPFDPAAGGVLRAVDLREIRPRGPGAPEGSPEAPGFVLATFVLQRDRSSSREELCAAARALRPLLPRTIGVAASLHDADTPQILGSETWPLDGVTQAEDAIGDVFHLATFGSFVQAHRPQAARVHATLISEIMALDLPSLDGQPGMATPERRAPRVLDLYGGSGAISLALARAGCEVAMVESFAPAAAAAGQAAEAQGLTLTAWSGDVSETVTSLVNGGHRFDAVVLNPPRRGASPIAREAVARLGAPLVAYVSCDPDTLARDLDHFSRLGYKTGELSPLDMIPLTEEVETIAVLRRAQPSTPPIVYEDAELLVVDKAPYEPVVPQGEYLVSLMARAQRLPGVKHILPVHRLEPGTSGVFMFARTPEAARIWYEALCNHGRLIYLVAAKGVTPAKGAITRDLREGGKTFTARTRYRRLAVAGGHSILRVIPEGMRPHQIRRHLAAIGHPVLGDERYGHLPTNRYFEEKHALDRCFMHLVRIEVPHPRTGAKLLLESTLPGDLRSAVERATGSSVLRFLEQKNALGDYRNSSSPPPPGGTGLAPSRGSQPVDDDGEPSGRTSSLLPEMPSTSSMPPGEEPRISVPDLDESPRTNRNTIYSGDD